MTHPVLAVTGSTGALGGLVAGMLAEADIPQRLLVRSPDRAPRLPGAVPVPADYSDSAETTAALAGIETLFMVSAPESEHRVEQHRSFIDAAAAAGVRHLVYTSLIGASRTATFTLAREHAVTEQHIKASGMEYTFLRDNFYLDLVPFFAGDDDVIRGPAGDGRSAVVARRDIARSARAILADPTRHAGRVYDLTGPEALTFSDIARILTVHRGRQIRYQDETLAEAYASREKWNAPAWQLEAWVSTYTAIAAGEMAQVSDDVAELTGKLPISLADYLATS